jgi:hypothetical protein
VSGRTPGLDCRRRRAALLLSRAPPLSEPSVKRPMPVKVGTCRSGTARTPAIYRRGSPRQPPQISIRLPLDAHVLRSQHPQCHSNRLARRVEEGYPIGQ